MNTWIVGNHPVGHYDFTFPSVHANGRGLISNIPANPLVSTSEDIEREELGEKVFFMKGRIMAGQVDLSKNEYGDQDYSWLAMEEIEPLVGKKYWSSVKDMLTER